MAVEIKPPFPLFTDTSGAPVDAGYIYIGTANTDPVQNPIAVFFDAALSVPAAQPIRTIGGYPARNGSAAALFCGSNYSISVRDKNGVEVFTSASAALNGSDITLASGESLTAESGSSIDLEDGAALNIGDASGAGVVVTVAANARFAGALVPTVAGTDLGSTALPWDANLKAVVVADTLSPDAANSATVGSNSLPFTSVTASAVAAKTVATYDTDQPASTSDLVKRTQLECLLAACVQTSSSASASLEELKNVASITYNSPGSYTITFTRDIGTGGKVPHATLRDGPGEIAVSCGSASALVLTFTSGGVAADKAFSFSVIGNPGVADPIS